MGKGALADDHPLAAGCGCDEAALQELLARRRRRAVRRHRARRRDDRPVRAALRRRCHPARRAPRSGSGRHTPRRPLIGDARLTLQALLDELGRAAPDGADRADGAARVTAVRARIRAGLQAQGRETELGLLETIEHVLPDDAITAWDMTILAYWAAPHLAIRAGQQFHYPLGSGTLGYAWPAAIGASIANPDRPVLAVVGDGGLQYALGELGAAAAHPVAAKLLVVDDGGYGILREYQRDEFGATTSVDLPHTDIAAVARACGVPVATATPDDARRPPALGARATRSRQRWCCGRGSRRRPRRHDRGRRDRPDERAAAVPNPAVARRGRAVAASKPARLDLASDESRPRPPPDRRPARLPRGAGSRRRRRDLPRGDRGPSRPDC